ncbi:MAG: hypothetical protein ACLVJX_09480 [Merdibacter sp.]
MQNLTQEQLAQRIGVIEQDASPNGKNGKGMPDYALIRLCARRWTSVSAN